MRKFNTCFSSETAKNVVPTRRCPALYEKRGTRHAACDEVNIPPTSSLPPPYMLKQHAHAPQAEGIARVNLRADATTRSKPLIPQHHIFFLTSPRLKSTSLFWLSLSSYRALSKYFQARATSLSTPRPWKYMYPSPFRLTWDACFSRYCVFVFSFVVFVERRRHFVCTGPRGFAPEQGTSTGVVVRTPNGYQWASKDLLNGGQLALPRNLIFPAPLT